jgi:hypothetical protein
MFNIYKLSTGEWLGVIEQPCYSCHYEAYIFDILDSIFEELGIEEKDKPILHFYLNNDEEIWEAFEAFDKITFILPSTVLKEKIKNIRKKYHTIKTINEVFEDIFGKKR